MIRPAIFSLCFFLACCYSSSAQGDCSSLRYQDTIFHSVNIDTGIYFASATAYLGLSPQNLYLDFYEPAGDTLTKRPLIVYQFGGGFAIGWREEPDIPQFCTYFAQLGYAVATIDYRLGFDPVDSNSTVRAYYRAVQDERSAIRFLCQNAGQFRIDTANIILTGTSAGCFCALANAYTDDSDRPAATYGSLLEPTDLGCMDCSGNTDFNMHIPHLKAIVDMWGAILDTNYIALWKNVPTIFFQGDEDVIVPYTYGYPFQLPVFPPVYGSVPMHQRMDDVGILNSFHPLIGYGHEPELLAPWLNDTIYSYSQQFLYPLLRPATPVISGDTVICAAHSATYSAPALAGTRYCWQLNGNGSIVQNNNYSISVMWSDTGVVSVSLSEMNDNEVQSDTAYFETRVVPAPYDSFDYTIQQLSVTFVNQSQNAVNYLWAFGNGGTSDSINPVENYNAPGHYTIWLYINNTVCSDTSNQTIVVDSCPVAKFTDTVSNLNGFFYADSTNTVLYKWLFGDGDSVSVNSPSVFHAYQRGGVYEVILFESNVLGCEVSDTIIIQAGNQNTSGIAELSQLPNIICSSSGCAISLNNPANFEVFDISGQRIFQHKISGNYLFDTQKFSPGVYFLRLSDGFNQWVKKLAIF